MQKKVIAIGGEQQLPAVTPPAAATGLWLQATYRIDTTVRGAATGKHIITLDENGLLELVFDDGSTWMVDQYTIEEVFPEAMANPTFDLPATITAPGSDRGMLSSLGLVFVHHYIKSGLGDKVKEIATAFEDKQLGNQPGLYKLDAAFNFLPFAAGDKDKPYLLFLHGTASSTIGSFGGLKGSKLWDSICKTYGNNVLALQHRSLTESPLQNLLQLLQQLPEMISLHLITHSRGGLIGEVLSRYCIPDENNNGFSDAEIALLNKQGRTADLQFIQQIKDIMKAKKISIRKYIRVACPAAGTTLAGSRLDHFFNVMGNLAEVVATPAIDILKELIAAVLDTKNDMHVLPGLEAMNPDSPFIKVLNDVSFTGQMPAPLMVISGNCTLSLSLKAFAVILSKLFFLRHNDLIVNTGSMYQGTNRKGLQYFYTEGEEVSHFNYFRNGTTQQMIQQVLEYKEDGLVPGFKYMTPEEAAASRGLEGGKLFLNTVSGNRPIAVIVPGIMGSNLAVDNTITWIDYFQFIAGKLSLLNMDTANITAPSIVGTSYQKLATFLSDTYDVVTFPFDWRKQLNDSAALFNDKILELLKYNQPIKIIGHSMGGVLVRDFIITQPDTWQKLNASKDFRLLFLGAPLGGSFRIPYVLFGKDALISKLSLIDIFHTKQELLEVFSQMPGILSLLPLTTDKASDMADPAVWEQMRTAFGKPEWPVPDTALLSVFKQYRDRINQDSNNIDLTNAVYIAGKDRETICSFAVRDNELAFQSTAEGDSSVTWDTGIPRQLIFQDAVYYVNVTHGELANERTIFSGIADILAQGNTRLLSKTKPAVRGDEKVFPSTMNTDFDTSATGVENTILGLNNAPAEEAGEVPLNVSVSQGDLAYAAYPLLIGHFNGDGILYAEKALDNNLEGALSKRHRLGLYPGPIGSSEVLARGAIVVGLGAPGELTAYQLSRTVEQGVTSYLLYLENAQPGSGDVGISALIIGCGYGGLTVESSVRAILQGVLNANNKIRKLQDNKIRPVAKVEFIEKYEHRAVAAYYALNTLERENSKSFNIHVANRKIKTLFGLERQSVLTDTDEWWNRITVQLVDKDNDNEDIKCLQFSASTGAAREEQRKLFSSIDLIENLIAEISTSYQWTPETAKTVFELLIPNDFKAQLKKQCNINWILDKDTAAYPWELLHDGLTDNFPLSVSAGMIRQLATPDYRLTINAVTKKNALIVADPDTKKYLPPLPSAKEEGDAVAQILSQQGFEPTLKSQSSSSEIIKALFANGYRIIHLAGHGVFNKDTPEASGMVIGRGVYLSTREIAQMSNVPELVFVNCCSLGAVDKDAEDIYQNRYKLAANIGVQLIENGVKAVVAAGWPVSDAAALDFTKTFYEMMFAGYNFGEAIRKARKLIFEKYPDSNTWGAYQCYGDPFFKLVDHEYVRTPATTNFVVAQEAEDALFNLLHKLETGNKAVDTYLEQLSQISQAIDRADIRNASITEKEALIYTELGTYDLAIAKFEELFALEQADYSVSAVETYYLVRCKKCLADEQQYPVQHDAHVEEITKVIEYLEKLKLLKETAQRAYLLGNAYKIKAYLSSGDVRMSSMRTAADHFRRSYEITASAYNLNNWLRMELLIQLMGGAVLPSLAPADIAKQLQEQLQTFREAPDVMSYWDSVMLLNIKLSLLVVNLPVDETDVLLNEVYSGIRSLSGKPGSIGKKKTEKEHLLFLQTALGWSQKAEVGCLSNMLDKLIKEW